VLEIGVTILAEGGWKLLYGVLAVVFIAAGVVSFFHPGDTFLALAAAMSFVLIFAGTFDIITAISARKEIEVWWLQLVGGIIELLLGFWAAGYYGRSATLLVAWVGAFAVIRGVMDIVLAFRVHALQHASASASEVGLPTRPLRRVRRVPFPEADRDHDFLLRGGPVRAADGDRLARGDLPLDLRDDQPEPGRPQASGDRRPWR